MICYDRFILNYSLVPGQQVPRDEEVLQRTRHQWLLEYSSTISSSNLSRVYSDSVVLCMRWILTTMGCSGSTTSIRTLLLFINSWRRRCGKLQAIEDKMENIWTGNNSEFSKYLRKHGTTVEKLLFRSMNCDTYNYVKGLRKINNFKAKIPEYKKIWWK